MIPPSHVVVAHDRGSVVWYSRRTGRHAVLDPASLVDPSPALVARLARLGLGDAPVDPASLVPVRSRIPLLRPDVRELWFPVPSIHPAGGRPWTRRRLSADELAIWRSADGRRSGAEVARRAQVDLDAVAALWGWACDPDVQAGQWRDGPTSSSDPGLFRTVGVTRAPNTRTEGQVRSDGETSLSAWHLALADVDRHFDDRETTVAHAHGLPHPGLGGRRYGEALADVLEPGTGWIAEVGCGTGELAAAFIARAGNPERYLRIDLSPALLARQSLLVPSSPGVVGDALHLPLRDRSVEMLLSNEVMADLPSARDGGTFRNVGAEAFVREVARVLAPGGRAFLSEFGSPDENPTETVQLDHPEVSIRFGDLLEVATTCGLDARLVRLDEFFGFDLSSTQLARVHHEGLRAMYRADDRHLPARAWTEEQLRAELPWAVEGLAWVPLSEPGAGPLVTRFWALVLARR